MERKGGDGGKPVKLFDVQWQYGTCEMAVRNEMFA